MAQRRRLIWRVAPLFLLVIAVSTAAIAWFAGDVVETSFRQRISQELEQKANLYAPLALPLHDAGDLEALRELTNRMGQAGGARFTVIEPSGLVLADSEQDPAVMDNHADRPEVRAALDGGIGRSTRYSDTINTGMMYAALPIERDGRVVLIVRTAIPLTDVQQTLANVYRRVVLGGIATTVIATVLALLVYQRRIGRPLRQLQRGARRFANGDLARQLPAADTEEIGALTDALNAMALQLDEKIRAITAQSRQQQAVLGAMIEGVIAVDAEENVIAVNAAAARWLNVNLANAAGRKAYEVVRNLHLQDLIARALDAGEPVNDELVLHTPEKKRYLNAQAAPIRPSQTGAAHAGVVVVLHDVTQVRKLEKVRQRFVSNVSHELKTPIAAIKAAVETVLDDFEIAWEQAVQRGEAASDPDQAPATRFLKIIARQADRLHSIVEDLLTLARIEEDEQEQALEVSIEPVEPVLRGAVETCSARAAEKQISVTIDAAADLRAAMNGPLLEQAIVNLLDNAVKYSPPDTQVRVSARQANGEVILAVRDQGPGIASKHLPRLFERFYRTDKARSRSMGGTGLGLSIVKHVAQAHGGRVSVDSSQAPDESRGSEFRIHLPAKKK